MYQYVILYHEEHAQPEQVYTSAYLARQVGEAIACCHKRYGNARSVRADLHTPAEPDPA